MHDIGRTQLEHPAEFGEFGEYSEFGESSEYGELGEFTEYGELGELAEAATGELSGGEFEWSGAEVESPLSEATELELASELLEVSSEQELEQFLGDVARAVGRSVGRFVSSDTGQALGGILKDGLKTAARQALPVVGRAIGGYVTPGGGDFGARAGSAVGSLLGLELEGLSEQDKEFEVARQLVRFTGAAINQAVRQQGRGSPPAVARSAVRRAARAYAPGLLPRLQGRSTRLWPRGGRWVRRGRTIVLFGM